MPDDINIEITEIRQDPEYKLRQFSPRTVTLVDVDKGIFVRLGIPETNGAVDINTSNDPYVFIADELTIRDDRKNADSELQLKNIVVLAGHGFRDENDKWRFMGGQSVTDTVNGYNQFAIKQGLPGIDFLAVCNKDKVTEEIGIAVEERDISQGIAYAAGTEISISGFAETNGLTRVWVHSEGNMFNLENLEVKKQIHINP